MAEALQVNTSGEYSTVSILDSGKFLGLNMDRKLNFSTHLN